MEGCVLHPPNSRFFSDDVISGVMQRTKRSRSTFGSHDDDMNTTTKSRPSQHPRLQLWSPQTRGHGKGGPPTTYLAGDLGAGMTSSVPTNVKGTRQDLQGPSGSYAVAPAEKTTVKSRSRGVVPPAGDDQVRAMAELIIADKLRIREQRRVRQIRYRKKKDDYANSLDNGNRKLREEIEQLEQRRRLTSEMFPAKESAWSIVVEYFRLFQYGVHVFSSPSSEMRHKAQMDFLLASMASDVAFNAERGTAEIMKSWRCISRWFPNLKVELDGLEKCASGSLLATTITTVTISEQTLLAVFPHLCRDETSALLPLAEKLRGQRIVMRGSASVEWDSAVCRVVSLTSQSDLLTPMLRLLGDLDSVSRVFEEALVTPDFHCT